MYFTSILKALILLGSLVEVSLMANTALTPKGKTASVYATASKKGAVISTLKQGEEVGSSERLGMYWKVALPDGQSGFVAVTDVVRKSGSSSALAEAIKAAAQDSRDLDETSGARARSAVMGVRGLDESGNLASAGNVTPNLRMVYAMEDFAIPQQEIDRFGSEVFAEIDRRSKRSRP